MRQYILMAVLCLVGLPAAAQQTVRVVVDEWAPFGGAALHNYGISLDVIVAVLGRAGYDTETAVVPFERAVAGVHDGTYDIIGNLFYDAEMAQTLDYSDPFYDTTVQFVRRVGTEAEVVDVPGLRPYSIAVGAGYLYETEFDDADYLNRTVVTTIEQGLRMVAAGRVDLTLDSVDVMRFTMTVTDPALADQVEVLPFVLATQQIHMAVRQDFEGGAELLADFNATLAEMRADGTLDALLEAHRY